MDQATLQKPKKFGHGQGVATAPTAFPASSVTPQRSSSQLSSISTYAGQGAYMEWTAARRGVAADVDERNTVGGCVDAAPEHQHGIRESVPEGTRDPA
ncbi:MAG TPA: hypothetical protein VIE66_09705 [Methylocella sp.]